MNHYTVRVHMISAAGFITQADHYKDFQFDSAETLKEFAMGLAAHGFLDEKEQRWIMPGAIAWVKREFQG